MPTILKEGPYRFFFYAGDGDEPVHVHVERDDKIAKIWLDPLMFQWSKGFSRHEITRVMKIVSGNREKILEAWHEYFGK